MPLDRGVMEMGAGRPGMFRGNELITFGPGLVLGFPTLVGVLEVFIFIGGGTKTVRTWSGLEVGVKVGRVRVFEGLW